MQQLTTDVILVAKRHLERLAPEQGLTCKTSGEHADDLDSFHFLRRFMELVEKVLEEPKPREGKRQREVEVIQCSDLAENSAYAYQVCRTTNMVAPHIGTLLSAKAVQQLIEDGVDVVITD